MTKRAIQETVIKCATGFGKPYLSVHKLRHSFVTDYYMRDDLYKTQDQLGRASPETTRIYAQPGGQTIAEEIDLYTIKSSSRASSKSSMSNSCTGTSAS